MTAGYLFFAISFGFLCSLVWLILGGQILHAFSVYVISGKVAFLTILGAVAVQGYRTAPRS